ncbi:MAG: glycoside hydrolase family 5 protein [archaeon]|nr:glycoside hydrolase family 5 protein [archaeon]
MRSYVIILFSILSLITSIQFKGAQEILYDMKVGWNLGNSLDAMDKGRGYYFDTETLWGNPKTTYELIQAIKNQGIKTIRVPVSFYNHLDNNKQIDQKWLARVAEIVNWVIGLDMYAIINVHHDAGMDKSYQWIFSDVKTYQEDLKELKNLWNQIANYFKDYGEKLLFEDFNEIMNRDNDWDWSRSWDDFRVAHDLGQEFINLVRSTGGKNAERYLILNTWAACADTCQVEHLFYKNFTDTIQDHLILNMHKYTNNKQETAQLMSNLANYKNKYGLPIMMNEFGTMVTSPSQEDSVAEVIGDYVKIAHSMGILCVIWDNGVFSEYGLIDRNSYQLKYPKIVEALVRNAN